MIDARLADEALDPRAEYDRCLRRLAENGALVTFNGIARPCSHSGQAVERLFLDHHPRLTSESLQEIARAAAERFRVTDLTVVHRCGAIAPGETIVFVAAASPHRRAAFEAADYLMDRLKTDAMFWKREDAVDGSRWIEPTEADRAERARWSD